MKQVKYMNHMKLKYFEHVMLMIHLQHDHDVKHVTHVKHVKYMNQMKLKLLPYGAYDSFTA